VPSMKLLNGLGFVQEGLLRDYLMLHGQWCNHYIYGLVNK
jgi:acetyltransferases, including N-acetylases of ribosomal proteins